MVDHFNKLSAAEDELLSCLSEEAGEIVVAIGKITRHGYESGWKGSNNRRDLETEIGDLLAIVDLMLTVGDIDPVHIAVAKQRKLQEVWEWLHNQDDHPIKHFASGR